MIVKWADAFPKYDEQRMRDICVRSGKLREMMEQHMDMVPPAVRGLWYDLNYLLDLVETVRQVDEFGRKKP